jgi:hypothetical protein
MPIDSEQHAELIESACEAISQAMNDHTTLQLLRVIEEAPEEKMQTLSVMFFMASVTLAVKSGLSYEQYAVLAKYLSAALEAWYETHPVGWHSVATDCPDEVM